MRTREWIVAEDGTVTILIPRYGKRGLGRWLAARIGRPDIHVKLDQVGSAVWLACDGSATVATIVERLEERFGERVEPAGERVAGFFKELERGALIRWRHD